MSVLPRGFDGLAAKCAGLLTSNPALYGRSRNLCVTLRHNHTSGECSVSIYRNKAIRQDERLPK